ncbi:MAG: alanine racemase [Propionibacteriaceae bacterium]|jgi:alanine racemase|nr:alanine racemase [Propionibacteriaceae bacterium]
MTRYETYALVDLELLGRNLRAISLHTRSEQLLLPVKANAYGHGLIEVATAVERNHWADWFGVATVSEAVALRQAGLTSPILKLSVAAPELLDQALAAKTRLTIVDRDSAAAAEAAADRAGQIAWVHLKVDSGMRRLGVEPAAAAELAAFVEAQPHLWLEGVFTHFAASDDPAQDDFTAEQWGRFQAAAQAIQERLGRAVELVHAANSGAVLAHPETWGNMVRPGILSYGYYPDPATPRTVEVEPVLSWLSRTSFVKTVPAGQTVSYGRTWAPTRDTQVATVPVGYGDGYSRRLSGRASVLIDGKRRPVVGRVCMDQLMVDLGRASKVGAGQPVVLLGRSGSQRISADDLGQATGTISYEVLCAIAQRVPRVYQSYRD